MMLEGAAVYTSDGKGAGKIIKVNSEYFTSRKEGFISDEEYRVQLDAILSIEQTGNTTTVKLSLSQDQLQHGYEYITSKPNSEFVSGQSESEPKILSEKPVMHYEAIDPIEENIAFCSPTTGLPSKVEYSCDLCTEKFSSANNLQKHRATAHKGPIGI